MPFREKLKAAFRRTSTSTSTSSPSPSTSTSPLTPTTSSRSSKPRKPAPQTADPAPVPKYRGPVNPAHQATLSAFSFSSTARRRSGQSEYSPMGSRVPSRTSSLFGGAGRRPSYGMGVGAREAEGRDDVADVALPTASSIHANDTARPNGAPAPTTGGLDPARAATNAAPVGNGVTPGKPFSEDELALAMGRSRLRA